MLTPSIIHAAHGWLKERNILTFTYDFTQNIPHGTFRTNRTRTR
jgi:hypothetical protein